MVAIHISEPCLTLKGGSKAINHIREQGLNASDIALLPGAAGGPKGIGILGLDRAVFGQFLPRVKRTRTLVGASVGSWRFAAVASAGSEPNNIIAQLNKLALLYTQQRFPKGIGAAEVSRRCCAMLEQLLGSDGDTILNNSAYRLVLLADRCRHLFSRDDKTALLFSLFGVAAGNLISRRSLSLFMQRVYFDAGSTSLPVSVTPEFNSMRVALTSKNLLDALMASASIPYVLSGVNDIHGAANGTYRDGGLLDYHLDLPWQTDGLVLYPHFTSRIIPGWFDKHLPWRNACSVRQQSTLLVAPSPEYLAKLPFGKLPSRDDFSRFAGDDIARERYWQRAIGESERLGDEFLELVENGSLSQHITPL